MILKSPNQLGHFAPIKQSMDGEGDNDVSGYPGNIIDKHESEVRRTSVVRPWSCVCLCVVLPNCKMGSLQSYMTSTI